MAELNVAGSFVITIGTGKGPDLWVEISANTQDGHPFNFPSDPSSIPAEVFVVLSAMFGAFEIPLKIVDVQFQRLGFCGVRVEGPGDLGVSLESIRPVTLGIVVDDGTDRGQALACACPGAEVTSWFGDRTKDRGT